MKRFSRISLVFGFLSLQLVSLAGGPGCPLPRGGSAAGDANTAMAGMPGMRTTDAAAPGNAAAGSVASHEADPETQTPASQPPCTTMAVCAFASAPALIEAPVDELQDVSDVMPRVYAMAPAATPSAPEIPPPRV